MGQHLSDSYHHRAQNHVESINPTVVEYFLAGKHGPLSVPLTKSRTQKGKVTFIKRVMLFQSKNKLVWHLVRRLMKTTSVAR